MPSSPLSVCKPLNLVLYVNATIELLLKVQFVIVMIVLSLAIHEIMLPLLLVKSLYSIVALLSLKVSMAISLELAF